MSGDGTYAPKSPDLSSFYSSGPTQPQSHTQRASSQQDLQPPPYGSYSFGNSPQPPPQSLPPSLSHSQVNPYSQSPTRQGPSQSPQHYSPAASFHGHSFGQSQILDPSGYGIQPQQAYPTSYSSYQQAQYQEPVQQQQQQQPSYSPLSHHYNIPPQQAYDPKSAIAIKQEGGEVSGPSQAQPGTMPPRRNAGASAAQQQQAAIPESPVRTKFPTARIKRIMQADEEVGKVAQQTPIAVGKALELFMVQLVTKSAEVAREKSSKRVTAQMLKHVVESDEQWDFLREIVGKVENEEKAGKGGKAAKNESDSDEEMMVEKKKAKSGRKKKGSV